jgi:hypothetical protein
MDAGLLESGACFFNKYVGVGRDRGYDLWTNSSSSNGGAFTIGGGLIGRIPTSDITPFIHGLVGGGHGSSAHTRQGEVISDN